MHGGDGKNLVQQSLPLSGACVQRLDGQLRAMEIVVKVVQLNLDSCLVVGEDDVPYIVKPAKPHFSRPSRESSIDRHIGFRFQISHSRGL